MIERIPPWIRKAVLVEIGLLAGTGLLCLFTGWNYTNTLGYVALIMLVFALASRLSPASMYANNSMIRLSQTAFRAAEDHYRSKPGLGSANTEWFIVLGLLGFFNLLLSVGIHRLILAF